MAAATSNGARIAIVFCTRPEIVKVADLVHRLGAAAVVINTGQHWDDAMSGVFLRDLGLGRPHHNLGIGGLPRGEQIGRATAGCPSCWPTGARMPVVVQGDTNSALARALAADPLEIQLAGG